MTRIVECVPNFSEGRNREILEALEAAITAVPGIRLLDRQSDAAHHRSVFTFIGSPQAVSEAAFQAVRLAAERIDLTVHAGEHPRMGATDVVPFIPVEGVTMDECIGIARALGERVGHELAIPVFLYARAATRPERESLPKIRKGGFEALREQIGRDPAKAPDFGPHAIHPTAGCTAIGARPFLVAYNIYLDSGDVDAADAIAREIRTSSGGLPAVQAKGFAVAGKAQVSMNLLDIDQTSLGDVFDAVTARAASRGLAVWKSEIVGLLPERAIWASAARYLKLDEPVEPHLVEARVRAALGPTLDGWIDTLAGEEAVPGGGSAAALSGALAAALVAMVARLTAGRKAYQSVAGEFQTMLGEAERLRAELRRLVDEDAAAYAAVMAAYRRPKGSAEERDARRQSIDAALLTAAQAPLRTAQTALAVAKLAARAAEAGNRNAVADAGVAASLARTALLGARYNVEINVLGMANPAVGEPLRQEVVALDAEAAKYTHRAEAAVRDAFTPTS